MASSTLVSPSSASFLPVDDLLNPKKGALRGKQLPSYIATTTELGSGTLVTAEGLAPAAPASTTAGAPDPLNSTGMVESSFPSSADGSGGEGQQQLSNTSLQALGSGAAPSVGNPASGGPKLVLNSASLALSTESTDGSTSVGFKMVTAATQAVAARAVMINGQIGPTVAARFYAMVGTALYEAWQLFSPDRTSLSVKGSLMRDLEKTAADMLKAVPRNQQQDFIRNVMAETAFRVMSDEVSRNTNPDKVPEAIALFAAARDEALAPLGKGKGRHKDLEEACVTLSNRMAAVISDCYRNDGATSVLPYTPVNSNPLNVSVIERWTPEYTVGSLDPAIAQAGVVQRFLTPQWGQVRNLLRPDVITGLVNDAPEPASFLLNPADSYDLSAGTITSGGQTQAISKELIGTVINPLFVQQAETVVRTSAELTPTQKLIAEFWEDGGGTPFPPGTWMEFGKFASEKYNLDTGMDAKLFFGLGQALFSASVACWATKLDSDYTRPLTAIRELGKLGLIGELDPLTGRAMIEAYDRSTQTTGMIFADEWQTYQTVGASYSPPFPEFTSGHSTFSASAARMIELITGRSDFGASITAIPTIEKNPAASEAQTLSWDTWNQAAIEAGQSRLFGGIHFDDGNIYGRQMGQAIGATVFSQIQGFWA